MIDFYYKYPILVDCILATIIFILNFNFGFYEVEISSIELVNIISNLIDTSVSLAGFILAALTIIVSFKSNLVAKNIDEASNPLELIFSSAYYGQIVNSFKSSILELTVLFFAMYSIWFLSNTLNSNLIFHSTIIGVFILFVSIMRSLMLLFKILTMNIRNKD